MNTYTFHRKDGWYPLKLANNEEAIFHALFNHGTTKVVDESTGKTIYEVEIIRETHHPPRPTRGQ